MKTVLIMIFFLFPASASAQFECGGALSQKHFSDEIKGLNREIQQNVIKYRKLQSEVVANR